MMRSTSRSDSPDSVTCRPEAPEWSHVGAARGDQQPLVEDLAHPGQEAIVVEPPIT